MAAKSEQVTVAEFVCEDERRRVYLREDNSRTVTIGEESSGRMTRLAYGDGFQRGELHAGRDRIWKMLQNLTGAESLERALMVLFQDGSVSLADLLDECDARGVGYWFSSLGDVTGPALRRSRVA